MKAATLPENNAAVAIAAFVGDINMTLKRPRVRCTIPENIKYDAENT